MGRGGRGGRGGREDRGGRVEGREDRGIVERETKLKKFTGRHKKTKITCQCKINLVEGGRGACSLGPGIAPKVSELLPGV